MGVCYSKEEGHIFCMDSLLDNYEETKQLLKNEFESLENGSCTEGIQEISCEDSDSGIICIARTHGVVMCLEKVSDNGCAAISIGITSGYYVKEPTAFCLDG